MSSGGGTLGFRRDYSATPGTSFPSRRAWGRGKMRHGISPPYQGLQLRGETRNVGHWSSELVVSTLRRRTRGNSFLGKAIDGRGGR